MENGFLTAAYVFLNFKPDYGTGAEQVNDALRPLGTDVVAGLKFMAVDVECPTSGCDSIPTDMA